MTHFAPIAASPCTLTSSRTAPVFPSRTDKDVMPSAVLRGQSFGGVDGTLAGTRWPAALSETVMLSFEAVASGGALNLALPVFRCGWCHLNMTVLFYVLPMV